MLRLLLVSVPFLFVLGSILHFVYGWSKNNKIIGLFSPVNESIFEHSKLLLIPLILFWSSGYLFLKDSINVNSYFLAMLTSIIFSIMTMIAFYYTYKEFIGNTYLWIDIFDLFLSLFIGQIVANHFYVYSGGGISWFISVSIVAIIFMFYVYLKFKPFKTPFFYDKKNKIYGINEK